MNIYRRLGLSFYATATAGHAARHTTASFLRSSFCEQRYTISTDVSPGEDDTLFRSRLLTIWEGLSAFPKTPRWEKTLSSKTPEFWLSQIEQHTAKHFKTILSSHESPTISLLESLEWSDTATAAGVYLWVWKPRRKRTYHDSECYLYLGSASKFGAGLADKRRALLSTWPSTRQQPPKPQMRSLGMSPKSKIVTLFEVPF
ncbi:hypothetical protein B0T21DRAFT_377259 [Apiosordaria backusii]|uniref:Uncharacterized protein n=1 Tax=Apiosordaria backusii TaxID=314023 RepID=A0AA40A0R5_9PEZI|nr:hypothetical protein B0T21DRAFT_377259 [Apiosordaria backusii]